MAIRSIFLAFIFVIGSAAANLAESRSCIRAALDIAMEQTPEFWARFVLRDYSTNPEPRYLENQIESIRFFASWFEGVSDLPFDTMLLKQHAIAAAGHSGTNHYYPLDNVRDHSDKMRDHPEMPDEHRPAPDVFELTDDFVKVLRQVDPSLQLLERLDAGSLGSWQTPIEGVAEEAWPNNEFEAGMIHHEGSEYSDLPVYRKKMDEILARLKEPQPDRIQKGSAEYYQIIADLARYHHLSINAMPFSGLNNSIFMSHINYVFWRHDLPQIQHGWLDLFAFLIPIDAYIKLVTMHCEGTIDVVLSESAIGESLQTPMINGGEVIGVNSAIEFRDVEK